MSSQPESSARNQEFERYSQFIKALILLGEPKVKAEVEYPSNFFSEEEQKWARQWLVAMKMMRAIGAERRADEALKLMERSASASEKSARFAMLSAFIALATVAVTVLTGGFLAWLFGQ